MTPQRKDTQEAAISQAEFQDYVREPMRAAIRVTLTTILEEEMTVLIGAERYTVIRPHLMPLTRSFPAASANAMSPKSTIPRRRLSLPR